MSNDKIIKPRPISGFPEWLPPEKLVEERVLSTIRQEFQRFGFTPIETPAVERKDVLEAKGMEQREIYALSRLAAAEGEDPSTEMALHFDLTVPLARYVAQHMNDLTFPLRRYQIQKVWRGERAQAGRFREFYQCDIDIIGKEKVSPLADAEIPSVIHAIFDKLDIGGSTIRVNNRKVLQGFVEHLGVPSDGLASVLREIDALEKVGQEAVTQGLVDRAGLTVGAAEELLTFVQRPVSGDDLMGLADTETYNQGISELSRLVDDMRDLGMPDDAYRIDLSIARGLDYYTGTVYETILDALPEAGSVCSGGRYDNLAGTFTRQSLPGVGISIGLSRLLARAFDAGLMTAEAGTPAKVFVTMLDANRRADYLALAATCRQAGFNTDLALEARKLGPQLKYASEKHIPVAIIAGSAELDSGTVGVKDMRSGEQQTVGIDELASAIKRLLAAD